MPERDTAAKLVGTVIFDAEFPHAADGLRGKGLVQFDHVDIVYGHTGCFECLPDRRNRAQTHIGRVNPAGGKGLNFNNRLKPEFGSFIGAHQ